MERINIELKAEHRGKNSYAFTGRPQGEQVRSELHLDSKDKDGKLYIITIPNDTIAFNASFFLGMLYNSIESLGSVEEFNKKYEIKSLDERPEIVKGLMSDIDDCLRQAINELNDDTGLDF